MGKMKRPTPARFLPATHCLNGCPYLIGDQINPIRIPEKEWGEALLKQAGSRGVPVFIKENAGWPERVQEYFETIQIRY